MKWLVCLFSLCCMLGASVYSPSTHATEQTISITKVESAVVLSIRKLSEQDLQRDQGRGWALFGKALLGGVLGYQYGEGSAVDVKSVLDTILRHNQRVQMGNELESADKIRLIELQVTLNSGARQAIILSMSKDQVFRANDKIRLVHFETGVFIDLVL
ncbi:hypothetical protein [Psychrobium sp. 1_MG-2023]|uniref:hypothetical protein n=1 Tax=Psychrobium sp. 1_MG-2023 TaxID=3062624 RepID=UPI000C33272F|nr:hypothetical protein [Psychrobium sp. 1_MG-2023]MDP2561871.1 hypothetical protein [Psychrobium sp. 1_MG-2023]PKF59714.1 hypothetical protein CW748_00480 [Alteromonadales bacterium alter-6D02]